MYTQFNGRLPTKTQQTLSCLNGGANKYLWKFLIFDSISVNTVIAMLHKYNKAILQVHELH